MRTVTKSVAAESLRRRRAHLWSSANHHGALWRPVVDGKSQPQEGTPQVKVRKTVQQVHFTPATESWARLSVAVTHQSVLVLLEH